MTTTMKRGVNHKSNGVETTQGPVHFDGEFFPDLVDAALDAGFLLAGAALPFDAGLVDAGFDLGLAAAAFVDGGFEPVTLFFGVTLALDAFFGPGLALGAVGLAFAVFASVFFLAAVVYQNRNRREGSQ